MCSLSNSHGGVRNSPWHALQLPTSRLPSLLDSFRPCPCPVAVRPLHPRKYCGQPEVGCVVHGSAHCCLPPPHLKSRAHTPLQETMLPARDQQNNLHQKRQDCIPIACTKTTCTKTSSKIQTTLTYATCLLDLCCNPSSRADRSLCH